ncbi:MAG: serine O-acetyltransferase [Nitrospinae bacterium RIFCSPLOWO2_12_39_16]|nr:MAG: serine O-acetyltransferase [Nitrospinae bacterium RIFCSPLOWO2_12_39_16]
MFTQISRDIKVIFQRDPAARSILEIIFCYPGFHALLFYRISHWLWRNRLLFLGRFISNIGRFFTGIEIHPAAKIGGGFFIDHGMGVVIGETTEIGENCTIFQGVTLGGVSLDKGKRHPTLKDNVIVGAGATILGPVTIGSNSRIGAGSVVVNEVPPDSTVLGIPGKVVYTGAQPPDSFVDIDYGDISDPVAKAIKCIINRVSIIEKEIIELKETGTKNLMKPQMDTD